MPIHSAANVTVRRGGWTPWKITSAVLINRLASKRIIRIRRVPADYSFGLPEDPERLRFVRICNEARSATPSTKSRGPFHPDGIIEVT